jgi:two-component system KDP operon response regulator KdpE
MVKPFSSRELVARINSVLRRATGSTTTRLEFDGLAIDTGTHEVFVGDRTVELTPREFELLAFLARHAGKVVTHKQILNAVWGPAHESDTQYLRVYVGQLRQKIELDLSEPGVVITEPGIGYRLAEPRDGPPPAPS